jgi:hypothetical protein
MARGWESKSIEAQQEDAAAERRRPKSPPASAQALEIATKRRHLELSLKQTREQLAGTAHPRRREQLKSAERFLQLELEKLPPV